MMNETIFFGLGDYNHIKLNKQEQGQGCSRYNCGGVFVSIGDIFVSIDTIFVSISGVHGQTQTDTHINTMTRSGLGARPSENGGDVGLL